MRGIDAREVVGHGCNAAEAETGVVVEETATDDVDVGLARDMHKDVVGFYCSFVGGCVSASVPAWAFDDGVREEVVIDSVSQLDLVSKEFLVRQAQV